MKSSTPIFADRVGFPVPLKQISPVAGKFFHPWVLHAYAGQNRVYPHPVLSRGH